MAEQQSKKPKSSKKQPRELKGEVIGGKLTREMCRAIMPFLLEAIIEMYEEHNKKEAEDNK